MVFRFYPTKDATLYERYPSKNTGMDSSLELRKDIVGTTLSSSIYNSRIVIAFASNSLDRIREFHTGSTNPNAGGGNWFLKLYACETSEIPSDYNLHCYLLSQSWTMGVGKDANIPQTTEGVSWNYRVGAAVTSSAWSTGSYGANETGSWTTNPGGGVWHTDAVSTQSFMYSTTNINMSVNNLVSKWIGDGLYAVDNHINFIIKKSDTDEQSRLTFSSVKFFSKDTSTVFLPVLEYQVYDASFTGSLTFVDTDASYGLTPVNLQATYGESSTPIIRFVARSKYPNRSFTTSSFNITKQLVSGSRYAIYSAQSDDEVIGFSEATTVSHDGTSNYFKLYVPGLQPERFYRILIQVPNSGSAGHQVYDHNWVFKVVRNSH